MTHKIVVLDYGSGNLRSAERALARVGADVTVTADLNAAAECDGLVVPGVGAYAACMAGLRGIGGEKVIAGRVEAGRPVLGICVGMQILFSAGDEFGVHTEGCGVFPGPVARLDAPVLPHMGWNTIAPPAGSVLFNGVPDGTRFYFVHSFAMRMRDAGPLASAGALYLPGGRPPVPPAVGYADKPPHSASNRGAEARITVAEHGEPFAAAVEQGVVSATQFHPEKSGDAGAAVLTNWLESL
jgi:glutamine amidotransferase